MPENPKPHKSNQLNFSNNIPLVTLPGLVPTLVSARAWPALHQFISHCHDRDTDMQHCSTIMKHFHLGHSTALSDAVILIVLIWSYGLSLRMLQACSQCGKPLCRHQSALQARTHIAGLQNILRCCISCKECPEIRRWCLQQNLCDYLSLSSQRILSSQSQQLVHPHISRSHISDKVRCPRLHLTPSDQIIPILH